MKNENTNISFFEVIADIFAGALAIVGFPIFGTIQLIKNRKKFGFGQKSRIKANIGACISAILAIDVARRIVEALITVGISQIPFALIGVEVLATLLSIGYSSKHIDAEKEYKNYISKLKEERKDKVQDEEQIEQRRHKVQIQSNAKTYETPKAERQDKYDEILDSFINAPGTNVQEIGFQPVRTSKR